VATELDAYLRDLTTRLHAVRGFELVGVYAGGSYALGGYEPGRSDIDVAAVARAPVTSDTKRVVVDSIRHETLPCPARGLEFVLYPLAAVQIARVDAAFDVNLNTGGAMPFRLDLTPVPGDDHWFAIDRSILGRHGIALAGPPASQVFAPIPRDMLLPLVVESLHWHERGEALADDAVLNACRALRFGREDIWSTKAEAGRWALGRVENESLVRAALSARGQMLYLDSEAVGRFVAGVAKDLESGIA
jgi:Domain of unknown function (DUF4111)/Nucleotidyltransferase domain